jgi:phosphoglucomutase
VLTGFKFFADLIRKFEGKKKYIGGGEESYGFLPGDYARDKDSVASCSLFAEMAAWTEDKGMSVFDLLIDIYIKYGFYKERLINIVRKGSDGAKEIREMMTQYRKNPPEEINNSRVIKINDYLEQVSHNLASGEKTKIDLVKSDVLQFFLEDGSKISVRPSGTEPKIKFYFSVNARLDKADRFEETERSLEKRMDDIIADMKLS